MTSLDCQVVGEVVHGDLIQLIGGGPFLVLRLLIREEFGQPSRLFLGLRLELFQFLLQEPFPSLQGFLVGPFSLLQDLLLLAHNPL